MCRNDCDSPLILCARLCGSGTCLRGAPSWSGVRIRTDPAIRVTSARAAIRLAFRRVPLRSISQRAICAASSRRALIGSQPRRHTLLGRVLSDERRPGHSDSTLRARVSTDRACRCVNVPAPGSSSVCSAITRGGSLRLGYPELLRVYRWRRR